MNGDKPKAPSVLHMQQRGFTTEQPDGVFYTEKRGLLSASIGGDGDGLKLGGRSANETATALHRFAGVLLSRLGEPGIEPTLEAVRVEGSNNPIEQENKALLERYARVAVKHGAVSVPAIAARFQGLAASLMCSTIDMLRATSPGLSDSEIEAKAVAHLQQVQAFAQSWHYLHMDVFKEHELAFAKVQHKAGTAKGGQAVRDKKAHRDAIVREQAGQLPAADKPRNPSDIARRIRPQTLAAFKLAGLDHDYNDATFDKIVRRALA